MTEIRQWKRLAFPMRNSEAVHEIVEHKDENGDLCILDGKQIKKNEIIKMINLLENDARDHMNKTVLRNYKCDWIQRKIAIGFNDEFNMTRTGYNFFSGMDEDVKHNELATHLAKSEIGGQSFLDLHLDSTNRWNPQALKKWLQQSSHV